VRQIINLICRLPTLKILLDLLSLKDHLLEDLLVVTLINHLFQLFSLFSRDLSKLWRLLNISLWESSSSFHQFLFIRLFLIPFDDCWLLDQISDGFFFIRVDCCDNRLFFTHLAEWSYLRIWWRWHRLLFFRRSKNVVSLLELFVNCFCWNVILLLVH